MNAASLLLAAALAAAPAPGRAEPPPPRLGVAEIVSMLQAGIGEEVILRQVEASRTRLSPGVQDLLDLKAAGASDRLLAALIAPATGALTPREGAPEGFRLYTTLDEGGEPVLHMTNLDASGRRIGGEIVPRPAPPAAAASGEGFRQAAREAEPGPPPVIVNIYPSPGQAEPFLEEGAGSGTAYLQGRYPGIFLWPGLHRPGHGGPRAPAPEQFFGRPRIIDTAPYRAATAASRNRAAFHRH